MAWTPGDVSGLQALLDQDHLYASHINELRSGVDARAQMAGDLGGLASTPFTKSRTFTKTVAPSGGVADYMCDGTADEAEINSAIIAVNAAGGGTVHLQTGTFTLSSGIKPLDNVHLRGSGMYGGTRLAVTNTTLQAHIDDKSLRNETNPLTNFIMSDFEIDGSGFIRDNIHFSKGLNSSNWVHCKIFNIYCHDCTATGLGADDFDGTTIDRCVAINNGTPAQFAKVTLTSDNTNVTAGDTFAVGNLFATGLLTSDGVAPANNDTVTIDSTTYTFKNTISVAYDVLIGATAAASLDNLQAAINHASGIGTLYGTGTNQHSTVSATTNTSTTQKLTAKVNGTLSNAIATTEASSHLSFGSSTLSGGTNTTYTFVSSLLIAYDVLIGVDADSSLGNLVKAINHDAGEGSYYGVGTIANNMVSATAVTSHATVISALQAGKSQNSVSIVETSAHLSLSSSTLQDGTNVIVGHNGIGIASGGHPTESLIVSNCYCQGNADNDYLIEEDNSIQGPQNIYLFINNVSVGAKVHAFRNSGTPNVQFINNAVYSPVKSGFYISDSTAAHTSLNTVIKGNIIDGASSYGIYVGNNQNQYVIEGNIIQNGLVQGIMSGADIGQILGNHIHDNGSNGIQVGAFSGTGLPVGDIIIANNIVYNNAKLVNNTDGIRLEAGFYQLDNVTIVGNRCFDNQVVPTQRYGIILPSGNTMTGILVANNNLVGNGTAPILKQNTSPGISIFNNSGIDPQQLYAQGNVTGAVTFDRKNGHVQSCVLTGNISLTIPAGIGTGDIMTMIFTQDATGGWIASFPINFKARFGGLTLSTAANAVDAVTAIYDGTNWQEISRDLTTNKLTLRDAFSVIIPSAGNVVGAAITQNDTTNNPDAQDITNAGAGNGLKISQNGIQASSKYGLFVDTNAIQTNSALMRIRQQNASSTVPGLQIDNSGSGSSLLVDTTTLSVKGGKVGMGIASPATSAALDITSTTGALLTPRMTTTQKNALTAVNGMIVYDSTLNKFQGYENGTWTSLI